MGDLNEKERVEKEWPIGNLDSEKLPFDYKEREYGTVPLDYEKTDREPFQWVSEVAYKNVHRIVARGYDTTELMEKGYGLRDVLFVDFQARIPLREEAKMLDYIMILSLEDGLSNPAIIARNVAQSDTFLTQAVGASVMAFGHKYGGYSDFGHVLDDHLQKAEDRNKSLEEMAKVLVKNNINEGILGVSDLALEDPTPGRLLGRAKELGVAGKYVDFTKEIVKVAQKTSEEPVDIDMLGATGATMMDLGFSPEATWGILANTRAFGAAAHYMEEVEREGHKQLGEDLTPKEYYDGTPDRPVPSVENRNEVAEPAHVDTPEEWKEAFEEKKKIVGSGFSIEEEVEDPSDKT